jgi:plasmid replication initiation protein
MIGRVSNNITSIYLSLRFRLNSRIAAVWLYAIEFYAHKFPHMGHLKVPV